MTIMMNEDNNPQKVDQKIVLKRFQNIGNTDKIKYYVCNISSKSRANSKNKGKGEEKIEYSEQSNEEQTEIDGQKREKGKNDKLQNKQTSTRTNYEKGRKAKKEIGEGSDY